jgi:hypothetical protein
MDVTFEINGEIGTPSQPVAELIAENLRCCAADGFARDGAILTSRRGRPHVAEWRPHGGRRH